MNNKTRIALVVSHPIQHFCPQYVSFAKNEHIEFKVFFGSKLGLEKYIDENFKQEISWGNLNVDKFNHEFLNGDAILRSDKHIDAPALNNAFQDFKPDLVISYGYFQKLQRRASKWAQKNNIPVAYISDSEFRNNKKSWKETIRYYFLRNYFSKISYFLTVGDANEMFYSKHGVNQSKFLRMHFPIDVKAYAAAWLQKDMLRKEIREKYQIPGNATVLSVVGKLVSWKNQDHIIDAVKKLEDTGVILHLLIVGSGEMMEQWVDKAAILKASKVYFTGFVDIQQLPAYYAATDIYVHPASLEPHSIAISEAIYMGCPVLLSDHCGSYGENDDVQPGKNGFVYEFGNIDQMAQIIASMVADKGTLKVMADYSHEISVKFQQCAHIDILEKVRNKI